MQFQTVLSSSLLFAHLSAGEIARVLSCLSPRTTSYSKNELIRRQNDRLTEIGLVLEGEIHIIKEDLWGNRTILGKSGPGQLFGESWAAAGQPLEVSVLSASDSRILFFDPHRFLQTCESSCPFHQQLIRNFVVVLSRKNLMLTKKLEHMSRRTLRERVLSYLSDESLQQNSASFSIPYNRQQLADYLCTDRSALCRELSLLKKEGVLDYHKNQFRLSVPSGTPASFDGSE